MDNLFFGTPGQGVTGGKDIEIVGQEAQHISKVMRQKTGDVIYVADGVGTKYRCELIEVTKHTVRASILDQNAQAQPAVKKILAMGVIKKRWNLRSKKRWNWEPGKYACSTQPDLIDLKLI